MPFTQTFAEPITPLTIERGGLACGEIGGEVGAPPPGHLERRDRVRPDLAHEAVAELHVVREVHAVRAAVDWFTGCRAVSPGQSPFWASASISVPGAPASSLVTGIQLTVLKPGVEIWAPLCVAVALLCTFQPPAPRLVMSLAPVSDGEVRAAEAAAAVVTAPAVVTDPAVVSAPAGVAGLADAAAAEAATSDAALATVMTQNTELRRTAILIAGDLSATRHDRPPPLSDCGRRCVPAPANGLISSYTFQTNQSRATREWLHLLLSTPAPRPGNRTSDRRNPGRPGERRPPHRRTASPGQRSAAPSRQPPAASRQPPAASRQPPAASRKIGHLWLTRVSRLNINGPSMLLADPASRPAPPGRSCPYSAHRHWIRMGHFPTRNPPIRPYQSDPKMEQALTSHGCQSYRRPNGPVWGYLSRAQPERPARPGRQRSGSGQRGRGVLAVSPPSGVRPGRCRTTSGCLPGRGRRSRGSRSRCRAGP